MTRADWRAAIRLFCETSADPEMRRALESCQQPDPFMMRIIPALERLWAPTTVEEAAAYLALAFGARMDAFDMELP